MAKSPSASSKSSSPSGGTDDGCVYCGSPRVRTRPVTRSFGRGASLLVIEDIPCSTCPACGESWFTAATMHEIERIKALRQALAVPRPVAVATFTPRG